MAIFRADDPTRRRSRERAVHRDLIEGELVELGMRAAQLDTDVVTTRYQTAPGQFEMTDADLTQWRTQFQVPDEAELRGTEIPPVPHEHATWSQWASQRWPSLPDRYRSPIEPGPPAR